MTGAPTMLAGLLAKCDAHGIRLALAQALALGGSTLGGQGSSFADLAQVRRVTT